MNFVFNAIGCARTAPTLSKPSASGLASEEQFGGMANGLLSRVQQLETHLEKVSAKCIRLESENVSLRAWVESLGRKLEITSKRLDKVERLPAEGSRKHAAAVGFDDIVDEKDESMEPKRSTHGRKPTGFVKKGAAGVVFDEDVDVEEGQEDGNVGPRRSTHGRKATAFVKKGSGPSGVSFDDDVDEEEGREDDESEGPKRSPHGRKPTAFAKTVRAAGVAFDEEVDEVENEEGDDTSGGHKRATHGRKPTAFVKRGASEVSFDEDVDEEEREDDDDTAGPRRSTHGRKPTAFVKKAAASGVSFDDDVDEEEREDGDDTVGPRRSTHGRKPTAFVKKAAASGVSFDEDVDEEEREDGDDTVGPRRSTHGRKPTAFVKKAAASGVSFDEDVDEEEREDGDDTVGPKRSTHGRKPTAFAKKAAASGVSFDEDVDEEEREDGDDSTGPRRSTHGRKPTAFVKKAAASGVSFDEDVDEQEREDDDHSAGPRRSAHGRKPTAFVKKAANSGVAFDDDVDEEDGEDDDGSAGPRRSTHGRKPTAFVKNSATPGVSFDEDVDEEEHVDDDDDSAGPRRSTHGRKPTAFVKKAAASGVSFDEDIDEEEREDDNDLAGPRRSTHGRKPTAFVKKAASSGVSFDEDVDEEQREDGDDTAGPRRSTHGRKPTAFVKKGAGGVSFDEDIDEEDAARNGSFAPPSRATHGRTPTGFVKKRSPGVDFDEDVDEEECEEGGDSVGQTRSIHGRKPTAFVKKNAPRFADKDDEEGAASPKTPSSLKSPGSSSQGSNKSRGIRFRGMDSVNEIGDDKIGASASNGRTRVPTKFATTKDAQEAAAADEDDEDQGGVRFADEASESESESDESEDGNSDANVQKMRPSRARVPTSFAKGPVHVEDDGSLTSGELAEISKRPARARVPTAFMECAVQQATRRASFGEVPSFGDAESPRTPAAGVVLQEVVDFEPYRLVDATKDCALLEATLRNLYFFKDVTEEVHKKLIEAMEMFSFPAGTLITRQGSQAGSHFFIVSKGTLTVVRNDQAKSEIGRGAAFGENVILMSGAQNSNIRCKGEVELYGMNGTEVRNLLKQQYQTERGETSSAINQVLSSGSCPLLRKLTPYQTQCLYDKASVRMYADKEVVLAAGPTETGDLLILIQGKVCSKPPEGDAVIITGCCVLGECGVLFQDEPRDLIAEGEVHTLVLSRILLLEIFGAQVQDIVLHGRITSLLQSTEGMDGLKADQIQKLGELVEVVELREADFVLCRPWFFMAFCLRGQLEATLEGKNAEVVCGPTRIDEFSGVFRPDLSNADEVSTTLAAHATSTSPAKLAIFHGQDVAAFLGVGARMRNLQRQQSSAESDGVSCRSRSPSMRLAVLNDDKVGALKKVVVFRTLTMPQLRALADSLEVCMASPEETIFSQGDEADGFYIIHAGLLEVSIGGRKVRTLGMGDYVGERALLFNEPRSASVKAVEDCELWKMGRDAFTKAVQGPILDYMKDRIAFQDTRVKLESLIPLRVIGRGGFGVVKMVKNENSGTRYALKCVDKKVAVEQHQQKALAHERNILAELDHPFIIKFVRSFNGPRYVYFLMELVTGGELLDALDKLGLLQKPQARFYTASIILALEFLHERRIAYLDLKGENCLIDQHGYLKIIDFGVAERVQEGRIHAVKGTPLFMAPEVILGKGYTTTADLWSLGVCMYDFMIGNFPFGDDQASNAEVFKAILKNPIKFPKWLTVHENDAKDVMKGLMCRDPTKRLGAGQQGYLELKEHAFFEGFNWENLMARQLEPPFIPQGETYAEDAEGGGEGGGDAAEDDAEGDGSGWVDPDPSWQEEF
eukprot:TRINITY_DN3221_c0_g1_i4.p1 TRINITY_DN3221_c0_g1~~TRINITY_DN3221_c0_g1_i4.p1  ORF type:complete len:1818 (-),score=378.96 TRINITY_DN3221_c0_g1_i4:321-5774(-)